MNIDASLEKDSVLVMSWREGSATEEQIAAALGAVGFTVYSLVTPKYKHMVVPLPTIDTKHLAPYLAHVLDTRLGLWDITYTVWTHEGWSKIDNSDAKMEKLT